MVDYHQRRPYAASNLAHSFLIDRKHLGLSLSVEGRYYHRTLPCHRKWCCATRVERCLATTTFANKNEVGLPQKDAAITLGLVQVCLAIRGVL